MSKIKELVEIEFLKSLSPEDINDIFNQLNDKIKTRNSRIEELEQGRREFKAECQRKVDFKDSNIRELCEEIYKLEKANEWTKCSDGLPPPAMDIGGTEFSVNVLSTNGDDYFIDYAIYPHGVYGADTTPHLRDKKKSKPATHWKPIQAPEGDE